MFKKPKVLYCPKCRTQTFKRSLVSKKVGDFPVSFIYYVCDTCGSYEDVFDENGKIIDDMVELEEAISKLNLSSVLGKSSKH